MNHAKIRIGIFLTLLVSLFPLFIFSQDYPAILIKNQQEQYVPMKMNSLKIDVKVTANISTTTIDMTFYNGLDRVLEGKFYFPLGEDQTVSRFAMDINGKMRQGVVVEKSKGRQVFEEIVRRKIDPGLIEWTKGNNFKARIYPIPAKGYKRLSVSYEQELKDTKDGLLYLLPLAFKEKVDNFSLRIEVLKQKVKPHIDSANELLSIHFYEWKETYIAEMKEKDFTPDKQLAFLLPKTDPYSQISLGKWNKDVFFYIHINPELVQLKKNLPKKICIIWDASASTEKKDVKKELALLDRYFKKIDNISIELVIFRNEVEKKSEKYSIKKGNWNKLKNRIKKIQYDGGTQLGSIDFNKYSCDELILSTDGISNFGVSTIKLKEVPVVVINSQLQANHSYLRYIAQKTSGIYLNLKKITTEDAFEMLLNRPYSFIKADYNKNKIKEVYPSIPFPVQRDFSISGILKEEKAEITLHFGLGNKKLHSKTIALVQPENLGNNELLGRIWAQKKIAELDMQYDKYKDEILKTGKKFSIVTQDTSLIVLETLEDYVKYHIVPPEELQTEYFNIIEQEKYEQKKSNKEHMDEIYYKFKELKDWWNTEFSWDRRPEKEDKKEYSPQEHELDRTSDTFEEEMLDGEAEPLVISEALDEYGNGEEEEKSLTEKGDEESGISLTKWDPDTPYLKELKRTKTKDIYSVYLRLKKDYPSSSAFYLDVADFFIENKQETLSIRILSNIAEMELENHQLLRILGYRLLQLGYFKLAIFIFEEVLKMREEEPQSYRDLGLAYEKNKQFQKAVNMLYKVVEQRWDSRFPDIQLIALSELNSIIGRHKNIIIKNMDKRLIENLPVDIRVILNWDADLTDMDLWITNPNEEKCFYSNPLTYLGGRISKDFTQGYGPEEYMLKQAKPGKYSIEVNYYGNTQQILAGATTISVQLFLNYGRKNQIVKEITLRLKDKKEVVNVGEFNIKIKKDTVQF